MSSSNSQESFQTARDAQSSYQSRASKRRYVHVFQGNNSSGGYLFVRNLGVDGIYHAQLVLQQLSNGLSRPLIRKVYARRTFRNQERTEVDRLHDNDMDITEALLQRNPNLGIARLYSSDKFIRGEKVTRESYWFYPNGGSLGHLLQESWVSGITLPRSLSLHILYQLLDTLEQMHRQPTGPVFHTGVSDKAIHVHFTASDALPDVVLTNFSHAVSAPFSSKTNWDVPAVISLIRDKFPQGHLDDFINPLNALHAAFLISRGAAEPVSNRRSSLTFDVPSLRPILAQIETAMASRAEPTEPELRSLRKMSGYEESASLKPKTYGSLDKIQGATGIHGPWMIGELDPVTGEITVHSPSGGDPDKESYHRPNLANSASDTDSSGVAEDFVNVGHDDCDEDSEGYVKENVWAGSGQDEEGGGSAWTMSARGLLNKFLPKP